MLEIASGRIRPGEQNKKKKQMRYILLVILLSFLSCTEPIKNGIVVSKEHTEQRFESYLMHYFNGKTTIVLPQTRIIDESWNIVICDTASRHRKVEVSESIFNQVQIGDKVTINRDTILIENN